MPMSPMSVAPRAIPSENSGWAKFSAGKYGARGS